MKQIQLIESFKNEKYPSCKCMYEINKLLYIVLHQKIALLNIFEYTDIITLTLQFSIIISFALHALYAL